MNDIPEKLFNTFNKVTYYDVPHKYYLGDKELISATTFIHKYQEPFDEEYWSGIKAFEYGITKQDVKNCWNFINLKGTTKGSIIHDYTENLFLNKVFYYPKDLVIKEFGFDPIWNEYLLTKKLVDNFKKDTLNKLIPIKTEFILYDEESMIAGMTDMLFFNVKANEYQIWDYKTNKKLEFSNNFNKLKYELSHLDDCEFNIYSLQLSLYRYLIEKNTGLKLGDSYIVWFSHKNNNYKVYKINDYRNLIELMFINRIKDLRI